MASQRSATAILYFITLFSVIVVTNFAYKCESRHLGQIKVAQDNGFKEMVASAPMEESGEKILPIPSPLPPIFNSPSPLFPFPPPVVQDLPTAVPPPSAFSLPPIFHSPPFPSFFTTPPPPKIYAVHYL